MAPTPFRDAAPARPGPLRLVVAGEFSSGKSTAINALLRQRLLPSAIGGLKAPPIRLRHGPQMRVTLVTAAGGVHPASSVLAAIQTGVATEIRVEAPFPALRGVELVEVPARPDNVFDEAARAIIASADMLIWCSISSQAWRLSEKAFIEDLPPGLRTRSVLLLSRADKLRSNEDCDKIMRRLEREAATYFANVIFMGGAPDLIEASASDDSAWQDTGGKYIVDLAQEIVGGRIDDAGAALPFPEAPGDSLPPAQEPAVQPPARAQALVAPDTPADEAETPRAPVAAEPSQVVPFKPQRPTAPEVAPRRVEFLRAARSEVRPEADPSRPAADPSRLLDDLVGLRLAAEVDILTGRVRRSFAGSADEAMPLAATAALLATTQARAAQLTPGTEPMDEMVLTFGSTALILRPLDPDLRGLIILSLDRDGSNVSVARVILREMALLIEKDRARA